MSDTENFKRLDRAIKLRCGELGIQLKDLATMAGITPEALRQIRRGLTRPTPTTAVSLDTALRWRLGSVEAILSGGAETPLGPDDNGYEPSPVERMLMRRLAAVEEELRSTREHRGGQNPADADDQQDRAV